ncbi:hypothetical protein [Ruegeria sp. HKCCD9179]|uniref:hypothetical protein n=1 Tax=Ruegeria sp. HKCCD9179 TaxID=2683016 RepID=UPI001489F118|nr:hypothetical protein [Ruegeria sp. HKCCD9179]
MTDTSRHIATMPNTEGSQPSLEALVRVLARAAARQFVSELERGCCTDGLEDTLPAKSENTE